jgi:ribosome-binding protein aMBF1 (putative translation factor)
MSNSKSFTSWKRKMLEDPEIKREYDALEPEYAIISSIIKARIKRDLTQSQLAAAMGTTQSVIARLESGNANPSLRSLKKIALALGGRLQVKIILN